MSKIGAAASHDYPILYPTSDEMRKGDLTKEGRTDLIGAAARRKANHALAGGSARRIAVKSERWRSGRRPLPDRSSDPLSRTVWPGGTVSERIRDHVLCAALNSVPAWRPWTPYTGLVQLRGLALCSAENWSTHTATPQLLRARDLTAATQISSRPG